jgi:hypothetical protein
MTPSYALHYVDFTFEIDNPMAGAGVFEDQFDEQVYDAIMQANGDCEPVIYMHCSAVNAMKLDVDRKFVTEPPDTMPKEDWQDEQNYHEIVESVLEHARGNALW